jgi:hypothetical protein
MHGLFTLQPLIWLLLALTQSLPLTEPYFLALHTGGDGLILIAFQAMVRRLFGDQPTRPPFRYWSRRVQRLIVAYIVIEVGLLLTVPDRWLSAPIYPYVSLAYWGLLTGCCAVGMGIAGRRGTAVAGFLPSAVFCLC